MHIEITKCFFRNNEKYFYTDEDVEKIIKIVKENKGIEKAKELLINT